MEMPTKKPKKPNKSLQTQSKNHKSLYRFVTNSTALIAFLIAVTMTGLGQTGIVPVPTVQGPASGSNAPPQVPVLSRDEAIRLALAQASSFQQAQLNERIAEEDVKQAKAGFLPKIVESTTYIYTSPTHGMPPGSPRGPSYIAANSISEYIGQIGASGELDVAGRLRTTLARNRALLQSAHAGTEAARRELVRATDEAYYSLALAFGQQKVAEQNLTAAQEFEHLTDLQVQGGEAAPIDLVRARLQTTTRRNELEQARAAEKIAEDSLRILVGYAFGQPIQATNLLNTLPVPGELDRFTENLIAQRPELAQFEAERQAAETEARLARTERRPQLLYFLNGGFDSSSLRSEFLQQGAGASASVSLTIPIFDWGASKSRERQAHLRAQALESAKIVALRAFVQQFYAAQNQARTAETRIRLAITSMADAERNVETSIARYRAGEASILEVTDAQNSLAAGRAALYQAIFDYQVARARLIQVAGQ